MTKFAIVVDEAELDFARQLIRSQLAVTIDTVEVVAGFKRAVLAAAPLDLAPPSAPGGDRPAPDPAVPAPVDPPAAG